MVQPYRLLGIAGSIRAASYSQAILAALAEAAAPAAWFSFADIRALPHYDQDIDGPGAPAPVARLKQQVAEADGVVIVSSEYNHGIPGVLKNALDWGSRPAFESPFRDKPVLIVTQATAFTGGVRAQAQLRQVLASMLARLVVTPEIVIGQVQLKMAEGRFADRAAIEFASVGLEALYADIRLIRAQQSAA